MASLWKSVGAAMCLVAVVASCTGRSPHPGGGTEVGAGTLQQGPAGERGPGQGPIQTPGREPVQAGPTVSLMGHVHAASPAVPGELANLPADPALNPRVTPPVASVTVSPELPRVEAPPGMISQQEAIEKAVAIERKMGAVLVLADMRFDQQNNGWELRFRTDERIAAAPRSHPPETMSPDPIERRKQRRSWFSLATELHLFLDGRTGEVRGSGFRGGRIDPDHPDLEHYRGRIVIGGDTVVLRLINQDGSPEGRDLAVDIPQDALGGLAVWHLEYGVGRILDVWGLTGPGGRVVAYRVAMPDPPDETLLRYGLVAGVPMYPEAVERPGADGRRALLAPRATAAEVLAWYRAQMPVYGWRRLAVAQGPANAVQFQNTAGMVVEVSASEEGGGTLITLTWPSGAP